MNDIDREILAFETQHQFWRYAGAKEAAILERWDMTATRYYQRLNALIDDPEALAIAPTVVNRWRRLREQRQQARSWAGGNE